MRMRVLRVIEYEGDAAWLQKTLEGSIHGTKDISGNFIRAATIGTFPEILQPNEEQKETTQCE